MFGAVFLVPLFPGAVRRISDVKRDHAGFDPTGFDREHLSSSMISCHGIGIFFSNKTS